MAKQTELKHLLQELEIATRTHERVRATPFQANEQVRAFHAAGVAEKRVFSLFDKLSTELEDSARTYKSLQQQRNHLAKELDDARKATVEWQNAAQKAKADLQELAQQVMAMKPTDAVAPAAPSTPPEPFSSMRAAAGEPIEVLMSTGLWIEKQYVGTFRDNHQLMVTYVHKDRPDWAPLQSVRMKPKAPQQLQMFADVFKQNGTYWGQLHQAVGNRDIINPPGRELLARDFPVTITVAK